MLVEIAIADAYGACFEYSAPTAGRPNNADGYYRHPTHSGIIPGNYTDDTQMSLAIAECLLGGAMDPDYIAAVFVTIYQSDRHEGYARQFQKFLDTVKDGSDFMARIKPDSEKSGGAMRAGPVGLLSSIEKVMDVAASQASITHNTSVGRGAAQAAALMVYHQVQNIGLVQDLPDFLTRHVPGIDWLSPHEGEAGPNGDDIVRAALKVLLSTRSLTGILTGAVDIGGDTDTVAAIAMAPASVSSEFSRDLPESLISGLENGTYGRDYLASTDQFLADHFRFPIVSAGPRSALVKPAYPGS
jgi:ADP-ribosyl-[dinitrogen reductase] hydrolase